MSEDRNDQVERADEQRDDVEAHGFDGPVGSPVDSPIGATDDTPDVEGHMHGGRPVEGRPVD